MQKSREQIIEANKFAMELLMPEEQFVEWCQNLILHDSRFEILADIFGVSVRACEARALNLGLINNI
jgi:Zn-dependent peptidase ImmA (M78 family)